jgi:hypothetical protein
MARVFRPVAAVIVVFSLVSIVHAAGARFWEVGTLNDFLKGDATSLSVDLHGRLILGPALTELADTASPVLWTGIEGSDGDVYLGSGNDGRVLKISRDGTSRVFFDSNELEVHALARAPGGGLYVGTSPDGRIYKVDSTGKSTEFFDPDERYIWALAAAPDGVVFAATGDKGLVYRITPDGQGSVFYKTKSTHVRSLLLTASGELLAGTESPGRVFRIGQDGSGFLVLDASLQEISALRAGPGGVVYAAAQTGKTSDDRPSGPPAMTDSTRQTPLPTVSTEITAVTVVGDQGSSGSSSPPRESGRASGKGAVYRIQPDGVWDQVWSSADDAPYDVALDGQGGLLVATGGKGKIYRVTGEPTESTLLTRAPAQQVTSFIADGARGLLITTANPGKILRLSADPSTMGTYESDVRDAEAVATWGAISWRGTVPQGTDVRLFTRTGNTAAPDDTWSPWSVAYRRPEGEQITSPKARYLQWKVELAGAGNRSPVVTSVTVAFQPRNLRPEITSITVHPAGVVFQRPFSTGEAEIAGYDGSTTAQRVQSGNPGGNPVLGRRGYQKGLQTFLWKAQDPNDDDLTYDVLYRREGETNWKALKRNLADPILVWDTTSVPNGTYVIKVVASDASANPPGAALVAERESDTFDIDNAPPMITVNSVSREAGRTIVRFVVKDADFPVQRVEYSLDADRWRPLYPRDGIADSRTEEFELTLDQDVTEKAIILRAFDGMNNVATARAEAPVPTTTVPTR